MEFLQQLLDSSDVPLITALVLGLLTAISPCPLATNITAIGFISKDIGNRHRVFVDGLLYTLGRMIAYTLLAIVLVTVIHKGADTFGIQKTVSVWGERLLPPALIIVGLLMLIIDKLPLGRFGFHPTAKTERLRGAWGSLLLGVLFAMAFCPTSGLFYFGMLIPMCAVHTGGWLLAVAFSIATGLPVVIVAWILAYSISEIGTFYNKMRSLQKWLNVIVALLFIGVGIYYGLMLYL
jgi:cytochrome c-type biogenesis protein